MDELGPGLDGVGAEVPDGPNATADVVAALDDSHIETLPREFARGGHSRHPGADHEDIGVAGGN